MSVKWIGAILVIAGCGGAGFSITAKHRQREIQMRQLMAALQYMESDLQYRLTPLPELCRSAGRECSGILREVFCNLARELSWQTAPDAGSCMHAALKRSHDLSPELRKLLLRLGRGLGRFDLQGQIRSLQAVQGACKEELIKMCKNRDTRLRSYQTLGLCAGAALAILFA